MNATPDILYKYRTYEGIDMDKNYGTKTLVEFQLFANSHGSFNDPFDLAMPYKYDEETFTKDNFIKRYINAVHKHKRGTSLDVLRQNAINRYNYIIDNPKRHWDENAEVIAEMDNKFYGILSLSKISNSILMWSHYANFHQGYCIGFDCDGFLRSIASNYQQYGCKFGPVNYVSDYPSIDFMKEFDVLTSFERCFSKHECWSYEEEYRLVLHNKANEIIRYPKDIVKEIYLGCKINDAYKREIKDFLIKNKLDVKLFQMEMGYHKFELVATPVDYNLEK